VLQLKQAAFWSRRHVIAGSDCGHVFVWRRPSAMTHTSSMRTGRVMLVAVGDARVVNCIQPHPTFAS
jgi:hypothetical protein